MQTPQALHVDGEQWLPTMSPCHPNSSTAEGSHLCPPSLWGSRPTPPRGTGALRGQAPSRKGTLRSAPQTFPATLAWPSRGLYLDLQEEKPGERRLATFLPCLKLPFPGWEGGSETRCLSHPPLSPLIPAAGPWPPRVRWLLPPACTSPAGMFTPHSGLSSTQGGLSGPYSPKHPPVDHRGCSAPIQLWRSDGKTLRITCTVPRTVTTANLGTSGTL